MKRKCNDDPSLRAVYNKYVDNGWLVLNVPKGTQNDLIAQKINSKQTHFIQVICEQSDLRLSGVQNGTFIQNAFSNGATPVRATIKTLNDKIKVSLSDANTNTKIIIRKPKQNTNEKPPVKR